MLLQVVQLELNDIPYSLCIYTKIFMNQFIAHCINIPPWDVRKFFFNISRDVFARLSNDLRLRTTAS